MTNEELAKSITPKINKMSNRAVFKFIGILFAYIIGFCLMCIPLVEIEKNGYNVPIAVSLIIGIFLGVTLLIYISYLQHYSEIQNKKVRDYVWDLVRQDERKRMAQIKIVENMVGGKDAI